MLDVLKYFDLLRIEPRILNADAPEVTCHRSLVPLAATAVMTGIGAAGHALALPRWQGTATGAGWSRSTQ